jgi:hypothetical protein
MLMVGTAVAAAAALGARYRSWHLGWGTTDAEAIAAMPGDGLLSRAQFVATRAVTIDAAAEDVWPWLVQTGFGRAGFYSYDWLDNLGRPSASTILPEFQAAGIGDVAAPMAEPANDHTSFRIVEMRRPHELVWAKPGSTWSWLLVSEGPGRTRLVTRLKARYEASPLLLLSVLLMEVGDFPMMRRMLLGISRRAEALASLTRP